MMGDLSVSDHLVNYDLKEIPIKNIKVNVQIPDGSEIEQVIVKTPDSRNDDTLQFKKMGSQVLFTVPFLSTYDVVVMIFSNNF
jgi:hypothetical protein